MNCRVLCKRASLLGLWIAAGAFSLSAQSTGRLTGIVRDPSGAAVPDALVSLYRPGMTDPANQTRTTAAGLFQFDSLPPESYRVTIEKGGFSAYEATDVRVAPGAETPLNGIVLAMGQQPIVVSTSERLQGVQTSNAEVATTLTTEQLEQLPFLNRNPFSLVKTQAGVVLNGSPGAPFTNIDGLRTSYSNVSLEGVNIQDNTVRYNGLDVVPNNLKLSQVSQFTLVTSNQSAVYGNGATQTAFVSPSGTNVIHGELFYLNSNNLFNANDWFQNSEGLHNAIKSNQGGANLGGPIIREKLFGYVGYEFYRSRNNYGTAVATLTQPGRDFLASVNSFPINPIVAGILGRIPTVAPQNPGDLTGVYYHSQVAPEYTDNGIARFDYIPSQRNTIVATYLYDRDNLDLNLSRYGNRPAIVQHLKANLFSLAWRFNPTARLTNEIRAGANLAPIDFINRELSGAPYALNLGFLDFLNPVNNFQNTGRTLKTFDFQDNASYVFGRHNLQFGFQTQLIRVDSYLYNGFVPNITLGNPNDLSISTSNVSQLPFVLAGIIRTDIQRFFPSNNSGAFGTNPNMFFAQLDNYAPYVQDNWKVTSRLALTLGVRYDYYTPLRESGGVAYVPQLNGSVYQTIGSSTITYKTATGNFTQPDKNNFAPTIGLAYDPTGKGRTAIRAAYGIYYVNDDTVEALRLDLTNNVFGLGAAARVGGTIGSTAPPLVPIFTGTTITRTGPQNVGAVDPNLRVPYVQQWSAGVQHEIFGMIVDARYVGNHAVKMLRQDRLILGNNVGYYAYNASNSTYNALQFDVSRRISRNLQFQANYTYSKALTDAGRISAAIFDPYRDQNNHSIDKSYAPFDLPHTFKANVIYDLPFGRDMSGLMKAVVGGWSISGIAIAQSGTRFSILGSNGTSTATTLVGGSQLYNAIHFSETPNGPSIIGASATNLNENSNFFGTGLGNFGGQVFFDTAPGLPGTLPLRAFSGPASFDLDLGIQKSFRITERQRLELRGIAVNVLNHPSFYFGDQNIGLSTFGLQNRGTLYQPRTVQLSAYYRF